MKYTVNIRIALPRERVVALFEDPAFATQWMEGLVKMEPVSGTPGSKGATARLYFKMGKREFNMLETILENTLPDRFITTYDLKAVHNIVISRFVDNGDGTTTFHSDQEFQFGGFMKLIGFLFPGAFRKQSQKYLEDFKRAAERAG